MTGVMKVPRPKKKCSPFMKGPTSRPCSQTSKVLPPMFRIPWMAPVMNMTAVKIHKTGKKGVNPVSAAMQTMVAAMTRWPRRRS